MIYMIISLIIALYIIIISTLFLMSINHISRPHKCPLATDGPTLEMTAHCITIWSKFSSISIWSTGSSITIWSKHSSISIWSTTLPYDQNCLPLTYDRQGPPMLKTFFYIFCLLLCICVCICICICLILDRVGATLFMFAYYRRNNYCRAGISVFQAIPLPPFISFFCYHSSVLLLQKLNIDSYFWKDLIFYHNFLELMTLARTLYPGHHICCVLKIWFNLSELVNFLNFDCLIPQM